MEDRNYLSNQYNKFTAQNYDYSQYQQQPHFSNNMRSQQDSGFSVNTNMPVYNTGAPFTQAEHSNRQPLSYRDDPQQYHDDKPLPSYEESHRDLLLSRSNSKNIHSSPRSSIGGKMGDNQNCLRGSFSSLFDIPGQAQSFKKSPDWASDNFNSSYSYQQDPQSRFRSHNSFSQPSSSNYSSNYEGISEYPIIQRAERRFHEQKNKKGRRRRFGKQPGRGRPQGSNDQNVTGRFRRVEPSSSRDEDATMKEKFDIQMFGSNRIQQEFNDQVDESDGEGNEEDYNYNEGNGGDAEKINIYIPPPSLVEKYKYFPVSLEEMEEMFKDLVIHFFYKIPKNRKELNPFVVVCESFRRSPNYSKLDVEDGYQVGFKERKFCTLRYEGMMMVRGVGENRNIKEPRVLAGIELINKLAMFCYSLEAKPTYYRVNAFNSMLENGSVDGVYTIVPKEEASDFESACNYFNSIFSRTDDDVEYMIQFSSKHDALKFKSWVNRTKHTFGRCEARYIKDPWIGVSRYRTPVYWRDKILASGSMETERFKLKRPQGFGKLMFPKFNIKGAVPKLQKLPSIKECTLENVYGPPGIGPHISKALPPWEKKRGLKQKQNRKRERKVAEQVKAGVPLNDIKCFRFMDKKTKQKMKQKFGQ